MILVLTNADTEILSLRIVAEMLPPDSLDCEPPIRLTSIVPRISRESMRSSSGSSVGARPGRRSSTTCGPGASAGACRSWLSAAGRGSRRGAHHTVDGPECDHARGVSRYLTQGGVENLSQMLCFVADTVLMHGFGFDPPVEVPAFGVLSTEGAVHRPKAPTVAVFF